MPNYSTESFPLSLGSLGHVEGLTVTDNGGSDPKKPLCHYFGGLPYALPPTGSYRFRQPRPLPAQYTYGTGANPGRYTGGASICPQPITPRIPSKGSVRDENCLQLNIWCPAGKPPSGGWPVYFYIHGGFLQWGSANTTVTAYTPLLSETSFKCMIVMPAYRLNVFGFLTSEELEAEAKKNGESVGNMGFWDQRMALEWTIKNIGAFGGNANCVTVGGYSAGSYSTFAQLAYDLSLPKERSLIRRAIMWSNGPGVQPKTLSEHQLQFDELLKILEIPTSLAPSEKLERLRAVPAETLVEVQDRLKLTEFRALSDGSFVSKSFIKSINDGSMAKMMKERGVKILNGECRDEHYSYGSWRTPGNSYDAVYTRLMADYSEAVVRKLMLAYCPNRKLPAWAEDWPFFFGKVYADVQVHAMERGLAQKLHEGGLTIGRDLLRYRIDWRASCVDLLLPKEWKVTHSSDLPIWLWGNGVGEGLTSEEKVISKEMNSIFSSFVKGEDVEWSELGPQWMKRLTAGGTMDMWKDERWEDDLAVWAAVNGDGEATSTARL